MVGPFGVICLLLYFIQLSGKRSQKRCNVASSPKGSNTKSLFIKDTWTRNFCCMPLALSSRTPSLQTMKRLTRAGCGKKKIVFKQTDDHVIVCDKIVTVYPRLEKVGGFTLHRSSLGGFGRQIDKIDVEWFDVSHLRKKNLTGSGIIYIRPLQVDLNLAAATESEVYIRYIYTYLFYFTYQNTCKNLIQPIYYFLYFIFYIIYIYIYS